MGQGSNPWRGQKIGGPKDLLFFVRDQGFEPWTH